MLHRLYHWTMDLAAHHRADRVLGFVSFIESSVFPVPPDVLLMPMVLARRERAWYLAGLCTAASVLGAVLGYALGLFAFEAVGRPIFEAYGYMDDFAVFQEGFNEWGAWLVFIFGVTFFPFKVITIASGVAQLNLAVFLASSVLARAVRFYLVAGLLWWFGPPIRQFVEARLALVTTAFVVLLFAGFVLVRYVF